MCFPPSRENSLEIPWSAGCAAPGRRDGLPAGLRGYSGPCGSHAMCLLAEINLFYPGGLGQRIPGRHALVRVNMLHGCRARRQDSLVVSPKEDHHIFQHVRATR